MILGFGKIIAACLIIYGYYKAYTHLGTKHNLTSYIEKKTEDMPELVASAIQLFVILVQSMLFLLGLAFIFSAIGM